MANCTRRRTELRNDRLSWTLTFLCVFGLSACGDDSSDRSPNLGARNTTRAGGSAGRLAVAGRTSVDTANTSSHGGVNIVSTATSAAQVPNGGTASVVTDVSGSTAGTTFNVSTVHLGGNTGIAGTTARLRGGTGGISAGGNPTAAGNTATPTGGQSAVGSVTTGGTSISPSGGVAGDSSSHQAGTAGRATVCSDALVAPTQNGGIIGDLAYDTGNGIHVGYVQAVDHIPIHAFVDNGAWQKEVLDVGSSAVGLELEVDTADIVHAVVQVTSSSGRKSLVYARRSPLGTWTVENNLTPNSASVSFYHLYLEADGSPAIVYAAEVSGTGHDLVRLRRQSGAWPTEKLLSRKTNAAAFSLNLDADGNPWIATTDGLIVPTSSGYVVQSPIGWSAMSLDFVLNQDRSEVLLSEPGGIVVGNGTFWGMESIAGLEATDFPILHLDPDGNAVATIFPEGLNGSFSTYRRDATGWVNDPDIDLGKLHGRATIAATYERPQAISGDGKLAAFDAPGDYAAVRVIEATRTAYASHDVDVRTKQLSTLRSMILDGRGRVYLAYLQGDEVNLLAEDSDGSWDRSILPLADGADVLSLTTDPSGLPTVALAADHAVGYATLVNGAWQMHWMPVEPATGTAVLRRMAITFGNNGAPHVFYLSGIPGAASLWHVTNDSAGPRLLHEPVTVDSVLRAHTDSNGIPHVVYDGPNLRMARWSKALWQQAAIAAIGAAGPSSFVDASGNVCVGDPSAAPNLKVSCDVAGQLVNTNVAPDIGKYIQLSRNIDGTLAALSTSTTGTGTTFVYRIDPLHSTVWPRTLPLVEAPSVLFDAKGGLRLAHFDAKQLRLYVTRCDN